jgi:hypothetical protein
LYTNKYSRARFGKRYSTSSYPGRLTISRDVPMTCLL